MGFEISSSTVRTVFAVLIIYSVIVVGFGLYLKIQSRKDSADTRFKNFLMGGKSLGPLSLAMLTFTAMSTSGSAVGGPGTGYALGFSWSICVWTGMVYGGQMPFAIGKKFVIIRERIGATSLVSFFRHRYGGSKVYAIFLSCILVVFLGVQVVAQMSGGAKVFAVATGTGNYRLGILLFGIVTLIYTVAGGVKSVARVAVLQGLLMIITVLVLYVGTMFNVSGQYGSVSEAMQWLAQNNPNLVSAYSMHPAYNIGMSVIMCWAALALPGGLVGVLSYQKNSKAIIKTGIIAMTCTLIYQFTMSGLGPFVFSLNQNLADVDYTSFFAATSALPDVLTGLFVAGIASAVQSTVAALSVLVVGSIVVDVFRNIFKPDAPVEKLNRLNTIVMIVFAAICILLALNPPEMVQTLINFASGGLFSTLFFPILLGLYAKRANRYGALFGGIGGLAVFVICNAARNAGVAALANVYPVIPGMATCLLIMIICMFAAPREELGRIQVWFGKDYSEEWADINK